MTLTRNFFFNGSQKLSYQRPPTSIIVVSTFSVLILFPELTHHTHLVRAYSCIRGAMYMVRICLPDVTLCLSAASALRRTSHIMALHFHQGRAVPLPSSIAA